jgi:predicted short-subunit dehydrogenase-like oxidoreductase (DUF2520 family)
MNYSIIGTGNMAHFLIVQLQAAGHHCAGIWGRNEIAAKEISSTFGIPIHERPTAIPDETSHCCFLAINDGAISTVIETIYFQKSILIHCSGASPISLLEQHAANSGVFWPIYSILKWSVAVNRQIPIAIEAKGSCTESMMLALANSISTKAFVAHYEQRQQLHLAAVFVNNFSNHLMTIAQELCLEAQVPYDALHAITNQTLLKAQAENPRTSQTGPAIRGDEHTQQQQLALLSKHPLWADIYESLSASIRKMYRSDAD